jgi:hypothetical protein
LKAPSDSRPRACATSRPAANHPLGDFSFGGGSFIAEDSEKNFVAQPILNVFLPGDDLFQRNEFGHEGILGSRRSHEIFTCKLWRSSAEVFSKEFLVGFGSCIARGLCRLAR